MPSVANLIPTHDSGAAAIHLAKHTDQNHVDKLKKISEELDEVNVMLRKFSALKRQLEAKNDGKSDSYDITELHEKLIDFQNYFNVNATEGEKLDFNNPEAKKALESKSAKELEAISKQIEDKVGELKDQASDASNQVYLQGHLYTIVMNIFQELYPHRHARQRAPLLKLQGAINVKPP